MWTEPWALSPGQQTRHMGAEAVPWGSSLQAAWGRLLSLPRAAGGGLAVCTAHGKGVTGSAVPGHPGPSGTPWTVAQEVEMPSSCLVSLSHPARRWRSRSSGLGLQTSFSLAGHPPPMGGAVCAGTPVIVPECLVHPLPAFPGVGVVLSEALGAVMDPRGQGLREFISAPSRMPPISPGSPAPLSLMCPAPDRG